MLKRLELLGFKSFATRAVFEFEPGICALVGPNGSGKSNVADAVRWVLGEQSARALRGRKAEEVIFVGSAGRHPLGMAEVALVLENSDRRLLIDFAEVRLARRLYRSGESEYLLNGARVRRKDLVDLLLQVGLHTNGYTVIGQGAVEELVMQRPEERRAVLDHAADIARHQARLDEARAKLAAVQQNLTRCDDLVSELEPHARRLRTQAEKAERYVALRSELTGLARAYYRGALTERHTSHEAATAELAKVTARCGQIESLITAHEDERVTGRDELAALDSELAEHRSHLEQLHRQRHECLADLASARQRAGFLEARSDSLAAEVAQASARIAQLAEQAASDQEAADSDATASSTSRRIAGAAVGARSLDELKALESEVATLSLQLRSARQSLEEARARQARLSQEREHLGLELEQARERQIRRREAIAQVGATRAAFESRLADTTALVERCDRDLEASRGCESDLTARLTSTRPLIEVARERLDRALEHERTITGRLEVARGELVALAGDTRNGHRAGDTGAQTRGQLGSSLNFPPEYELAIAAALGEWAQAEVVAEAAEARSALVREQSGRALFVANGVDHDHQPTSVERFHEQVGQALGGLWHRSALELIEAAENGEGPPVGPLAFTVIVQDLDSAVLAGERLRLDTDHPWQIATLGGQVITQFRGLARGSESVAERLVSLRRREAECGSRIADLEAAVEIAVGNRAAIERDLAVEAANEAELRSAELVARAQSRALADRRSALLAERDELHNALRQLPVPTEEPVDTASESHLVAARASLAQQMADLAEQERLATETLEVIQSHWERASAEHDRERRLFDQAAAERRARQELAVGRGQEIERLRAERSSTSEQAEQLARELSQLRPRLEEAERTADGHGAAIARTSQVVEALVAKRAARTASLEGLEGRLAELRRELASAQRLREQALLVCQQAGDALARLRQEAETTAEEWQFDGEGIVQLRLLGARERSGPEEAADVPEIDLESARKRLVSLQRELRAQGAISESVLDEYREVLERVEFLRTQSADLRAANQELQGVIAELETMMREGFSDAFERVNTCFTKTFSTLFGGGAARLVLTDPDNPLQTGVDIEAQPPGKRLQSLMSLSGGERALTSTALIFALLAINPLPFCVLDEVDAALDESNARRFAALLQDYAQRTQFIIITHNRATMEIARTLYGISMGSDGVTTFISLRPGEALADAQN